MAKLGDGSLSGLQKLRTLYHQGPDGAIDTAVKFMQAEVYHEGMRLLIGREGKSTGFTGVDEEGNTYANPSKYGPENTIAPKGTGVVGPDGQPTAGGPGSNPGSNMPGVNDEENTFKKPIESFQIPNNPGGPDGQSTNVMSGQSNVLAQEVVPGFITEQNHPGHAYGEGQVGDSNFVYQFDDGNMRVVPSNWDPVHNQVGGNNTNQYYADGSTQYQVNTNTPGYFGATKNIIKAMPTAAGPSIAGELGYGHLKFDTLYNHNQTAKFDDRLKNHTLSGWRGQEPYITHEIPVGSGVPGEWGALEGGRSTNKTVMGRLVPGMRALTDAIRVGKFILTGQGLAWEGFQLALQFMNPRNQRIYNPLSMISSVPLGVNAKIRLARGAWINPNTEKYTDTILEHPDGGNKSASDLTKPDSGNKFGAAFGLYFKGGNALQVRGKNAEYSSLSNAGKGLDISGVAPAPTNPLIPGQFMGIVAHGSGNDRFATRQASLHPYTRDDGTGKAELLSPRSLPYKSVGLAKLKRDIVQGELGTQQADLNKDLEMEQLEFGKYEEIPDADSAGGLKIGMTQAGMKEKEKRESANVNESLNAQSPGNKMSAEGIGDAMSLIEINKPKEGADIKMSDVHPNDAEKIESVQHGMPFYFKDLRTNQYIFLRAFIEGINEAITPAWSEEKYVGRSEPVHVFEGGTTRSISYSLKIFARSKDEFKIMWEKINHLTSLCYPEYKDDELFEQSGVPRKTRMKAPFVKMRIGELYGSQDNEAFGFIESMTYNVPDEAVWETEKGKRAPKYVTIDFTFRHLHASVPDNKTSFYGYVGEGA